MSATSGRLYGGLTAQERQDQRRVKLLDAGLQVFGVHGWTGAAVTDVCRVAQLSQRYFYEQFADREELFLAVSDRIAGDVAAVVRGTLDEAAATPLERANDLLAALATYFSADPRTVRVALVESSATPRLREHRVRLLASFAALG